MNPEIYYEGGFPHLREYLDEALDLLGGERWGSEAALALMPRKERLAYTVGLVDWEVYEGGWSQWLTNGNGTPGTYEFILDALETDLPPHPSLMEFESQLRLVSDIDRMQREGADDDPALWMQVEDDLDALDLQWYEVADDVLGIVDDYLGGYESLGREPDDDWDYDEYHDDWYEEYEED